MVHNVRNMMMILKYLLIFFSFFSSTVRSCIRPDEPTVFRANVTTVWEIYNEPFRLANEHGVDGMLGYNPLKQARVWNAIMSSVYSVIAYHHEKALDFFSSDHEYIHFLRRCQPDPGYEYLLEESQVTAFAYTYLWGIQTYVPEWSAFATQIAQNISIDLDACKGADFTTFGCGYDTDVGMSRGFFDAYVGFFKNDGWNSDGKLKHTLNGLEYGGLKPLDHISKCSSWTKLNNFCPLGKWDQDVCWKPATVLVGDQIYQQVYNMPHIANMAQSFHLKNSRICGIFVEYPCYDLEEEAMKTIKRLNQLDDEKKAKVEYFKNIFRVTHSLLEKSFGDESGKSIFETVKGITAATVSLYESTIVSWLMKEEIGMIRPKSFINSYLADKTLQSYLGPMSQGSGSITGRDWVPYVPDAASPEYPSHIACLCSSLFDTMKSFKIKDPNLSVNIPKHSSTIESEKPSSDVQFTISTWDDFESMCHESRLDSGNHFSRSTSDAKAPCRDVGKKIYSNFQSLSEGTDIFPESNDNDGSSNNEESNMFFKVSTLLKSIRNSGDDSVVSDVNRCGSRISDVTNCDRINGFSNLVVSVTIRTKKTIDR